MEFPQYRKIEVFKRYYKIIDNRNFIECSFLGEKKMLQHIHAQQYPEMLRIKDMLESSAPFEICEEDVDFLFQ